MTMILQLLVAAVAVGLTVAFLPEYRESVAAIQQAGVIIDINLLSMEGDIPLLNDSRRHYAEIVHVIFDHGLMMSGSQMGANYQQHLNSSAPEAIKNPENVIDEINDLFAQVHNATSELKDLVDACLLEDDICNKLLEDVIKHNDQYARYARIVFAAGKAAKELKKRNSKFEEVSKKLAAHPYVISTPQDLNDIVEAVADLNRILLVPDA